MSNTPKIRFKGFGEEWEWRKLGEITFMSGEKIKIIFLMRAILLLMRAVLFLKMRNLKMAE